MIANSDSIKDDPQPKDLYDEVSKRVGPKSRPNHETIGSAVMFFCLEAEDLANRIRRYQFIERYRSMVDDKSEREMVHALTEHTYTLRSYEIYTVLERGTKTLRFGLEVARSAGLPAVVNDKKYINEMKKTFDHRLRERHRIVHAHERPSLLSRLTAMPPKAFEIPEIRNYLIQLMKLSSTMTKMVGEKHPEIKMPAADEEGFYRGYLSRVDEEAKTMWEILKKYIEQCVAMPRV